MTAKVLFCALALVGLAGMFVRHRHQFGRLGRVGYSLLSVGFLAMLVQECMIGYYLPTIAHSKPVYVQHVLNGAMAHGASSGIGAWQGLFLIVGIGYSLGGLLFGIALFRAGVLARWASVLLAYGTDLRSLACRAAGILQPPVRGAHRRRADRPRHLAVARPAPAGRHRRCARHDAGRGGGDAVSDSPPARAVPGTWPGTAVPAGCRPSFAATVATAHSNMSSTNPSTLMNTAPKTYAIRVDGHLDDHWSTWLGELDVTRNDDGTTTITALIADQAQLHGVLAGLRDIGAVITELRTTDAPVSASKHPQTSACSPP